MATTLSRQSLLSNSRGNVNNNDSTSRVPPFPPTNGYSKVSGELDNRRSPFKTTKLDEIEPPRRPSPTHSADGFSSTSARTPPFLLVNGGAPSAPASVQVPYTPLRTKSPQAIVIAAAAPPPTSNTPFTSSSWCPSATSRTFVNLSTGTTFPNGAFNFLSTSHNGRDISSSSSISSDAAASTSMMNLGAIIDATLNDVAGVCSSSGSDGAAGAAASSTANALASSDVFVRRLIDAVQREPCLYNPNHEHYGNKHSSAQFRAAVWQNLCKELDYPEDAHSLQAQWKRVRDRYVRERRKRKNIAEDTTKIEADLAPHYMSAAARQFEWMRWIDDFLSDGAAVDAGNAGGFYTVNGEAISVSAPSRRDAEVGNEPYISQHPSRRCSSGAKLRDTISHEYFNDGSGKNRGRIVPKTESNGSPNSSNSEISVSSAIFGSAAPPSQFAAVAVVMRNVGGASICATGSEPPHQLITPTDASTKHEQVMTTTMMDPSTVQFYNNTAITQHQQQQQRMYRLVTTSAADMSQHLLGQPTQQQSQHSHQILSHPLTQQQSHSGNNLGNDPFGSTGMHGPRRKRMAPSSHHNADVIMSIEHQDGVLHQSSHQHNGNHTAEQGVGRLIASHNRADLMQQHGQNAVIDSMLSQHDHQLHGRQYMTPAPNVDTRHHIQQQMAHSLVHAPHHHHGRPSQPQYVIGNPSTSAIINEATVASASPVQYDPDAALVEMIVGHFGNLNDDEKVVTKMNIQRILMDARFGRGSCVRMFREEEQQNIENIAMEQQQQHHQQRHQLHHHQSQQQQQQQQQRQAHHQQPLLGGGS